MMVHHLRVDVGFIKIEGHDLHLNIYNSSPKGFREKLAETISKLTGSKWNVINAESENSISIRQQEETLAKQIESDIKYNPLVVEALRVFEGSEIEKIEINTKVH